MTAEITSSSSISAEDLTVGELLSGRFAFALPPFQRPFSWGLAEAEHLIDDISSAISDVDRDRSAFPFFVGTMLFANPEPDQPIRTTLVVDGQQRLTTLTILLAVLRDHAESQEERDAIHRHIAVFSSPGEFAADAFHLSLREADQVFMARAVQKLGATRRPRRQSILEPRSEAQHKLEEIRKLFQKRFGRHSDPEERRRFAGFVLQNCRALVMRTASLEYAYQIFLTINGRGLPLSDDDIVIAEVIGPLSPDQRRRFAPIVAQMDRYREAAEGQRLRGKTFFSHLVGVHGWARTSIIRDLRRAVQGKGGPLRFTTEVFQPMAEAYLLTRCDFSGRVPPRPVSDLLKRLLLLERICDDEWVGTAMLGLARFDLSSPELVAFLRGLDRFAHAQLVLRPAREDRRNRYRQVVKFMSENANIDVEKLFELSASDQRKFLSRCSLGLNETVSRTCKAVLVRLDLEISGREAEPYIQLFAGEDPTSQNISIEHVLPKGSRLPRGSAWRSLYAAHEQRRALANCIGNLILVDAEQNRMAGQKDFEEKKRVYFPSDTPHLFFTTESLRSAAQWGPPDIRARHDSLMQTLIEVFRIDADVPAIAFRTSDRSSDQVRPRLAKRRRKSRSLAQ